ncbi:hypothetical protein MGI18_14510 [Bacillus sp. OVS6]|nr:hypothetical protein MGI18_14510 [Bacillus sp. OVS6]
MKSKWQDATWISAYEGQHLLQWQEENASKAPLVFEGFEQWIMEDNRDASKLREDYRLYLKAVLELKRKSS